MVNTMGSMRCSHDSIHSIRALEISSDLWIPNVVWQCAAQSTYRGT